MKNEKVIIVHRQQTFITCINGAYVESFFVGGGEHFNISAVKPKVTQPCKRMKTPIILFQ